MDGPKLAKFALDWNPLPITVAPTANPLPYTVPGAHEAVTV